MIDLTRERLIPIRDVPALLPLRPNSRKLHVSAVYRWILGGRGARRLEAIKLGGTMYTSLEALQRFGQPQGPPDSRPQTVETSVCRRRQVERATREVQRILGSHSRIKSIPESGKD